MSAGHAAIEIRRVFDSYAIGFYGGLVVWVVDGHTPRSELEALRRAALAWRDESGASKTVALTVIHARRTTMSAEERRVVTGMIADTKHHRLASATVILSRGMIGALHRSILVGFTLLVPPPHPVKVTGSVEEAFEFLAPYIETVCGPLSCEAVVAMADDLQEVVRQRQAEGSGAPDGGGLSKED